MGLMSFLQKPEVQTGLGGLFSQMAAGGPLNLTGTLQQMDQIQQQRQAQEQLQQLMQSQTFTPEQQGLMSVLAQRSPETFLEMMAKQAFPEPSSDPRYNVGGVLVDAQGNEIYKAPEKPKDPIRVGDDLVVPDEQGGYRKVYGSEQAMGPAVKEEGSIRKEWTSLASTFRDVHDAYGRIQVSAEKPSAAGDLSLIFNYMKMLDPGSVVRESEFATAAASGSYGERIQSLVNRAMSGQRLSDDIRKDFVNRSEKLFERAKKQYDANRGRFQNIAEAYGFDPERTVPDFSEIGGLDDGAVDVPPEVVSGLRGQPEGTRVQSPDGKIYIWDGQTLQPE